MFSSTNIDLGAFRYIGPGEDADEFSPPALLPPPVVSALSNGSVYMSGMLTNAPVYIYVYLGDITELAGWQFLPQTWIDDYYANARLSMNGGNYPELQ